MKRVALLDWQSQVVVIDLSHDGCDVYEQDLAATPKDSRERFEARRLLPGMAKRIREVCVAVCQTSAWQHQEQSHSYLPCMQTQSLHMCIEV